MIVVWSLPNNMPTEARKMDIKQAEAHQREERSGLLWYSEVLPSQHPDLLVEITGQYPRRGYKKRVQHHFQIQLMSILEECFD